MKKARSWRLRLFDAFPLAPLCWLLWLTPFWAFAADQAPWAEVAAPAFVSIEAKASDPTRVVVSFTLELGSLGADKAVVELRDLAGALIEAKAIGRSKKSVKSAEFTPAGSGRYTFQIIASRKDELEEKYSDTRYFDFAFPLFSPVFSVRNLGSGSVHITWEAVKEAEAYELVYSDPDGKSQKLSVDAGGAREKEISGLELGAAYAFSLAASRGGELSVADPIFKTVRAQADRIWTFTWFGQSTKATLNTIQMIDADELSFRLNSCSVLNDGSIDQKGGKFTAFHDGVSFYYTKIDAAKENFVLSATFTIDYINPTADGQEGFGLLAMDSLGEHGLSAANHYTNSAGIIATKFEEYIGGVKKTSKDTLGARFVSGLSPELLALGDSGIAQQGRSQSRAYSYAASDLVKAGAVYRLCLKKTNTGYHAILEDEYAAPDAVTEYVLYGPEKLLQLDKEYVYVGFAVARGCNATISDVSMTISDPATDPPAAEEPPELVPLLVKVDCPVTSWKTDYRFTLNANADGFITLTDRERRVVARNEPVRAGVDYIKDVALKPGFNDYSIIFTPDPGYRPGENQVMAVWDREFSVYVAELAPVYINHSVLLHSYDAPRLHVSPDGDFLGKGGPDDPMDLDTALSFAKPGQDIIMSDGLYVRYKPVLIPRGIDGTAEARHVLKAAPGASPILDFNNAGGGMLVSGDYWTIEGLIIRGTPDNVKGLQVAGNHTIVRAVIAHDCGDTGIQISGSSLDPFEKWPSYNLVERCWSFNNCDPAANNADGFAAKLSCGEGNVFRSCVAYSNIDDGWDLYSKIESGPIGAVLIEGCVAFRNGSLLDGSGNGDGNGFKLGGDGIAVPHIIRNCIAYANGTSGISSNSDPAVIVRNCSSYGNGGSNINLYGKGDGERLFIASGVLSMKGGAADVYREMPELASSDNYFWTGAECVNAEGKKLDQSVFVNVDSAAMPIRESDGGIDMNGLFTLSKTAPVGVGARLTEKLNQ